MVIKDVFKPEMIKLVAKGEKVQEISYIEMSFSKDALIGFASNLLWIYGDYNRNRKIIEETIPLGNPIGNQVFGFYITTNSPTFVVYINIIFRRIQMSGNINDDFFKEQISFNDKRYSEMIFNQRVLELEPPSDDDLPEEFEKNYENIVSIKVYDKTLKDISQEIRFISLNINYGGLRNLGIVLLDISRNYKEDFKYAFEQYKENEKYENRIVLAKDSIPLRIKCEYLGKAYDYEQEFWR